MPNPPGAGVNQINMKRIYERVKELLEDDFTVWMYCDANEETVTIKSVHEDYTITTTDGAKHEMSSDAEDYTTVNYHAPIF